IIGLLRAQNASRVPLLKRYGYVNDTIATLDQAKQLAGGAGFRRELDRRHRAYRASRLLSSA
ncbi:MAG TPA: hypothetical protein VF214_09670, partial [Edaphobacter sp.]